MTTQLYHMIMSAQQRAAELRRVGEQARLGNDAPGGRRKLRDSPAVPRRSIRSGRVSPQAALEVKTANGGAR